jgi:hypothetical protein
MKYPPVEEILNRVYSPDDFDGLPLVIVTEMENMGGFEVPVEGMTLLGPNCVYYSRTLTRPPCPPILYHVCLN